VISLEGLQAVVGVRAKCIEDIYDELVKVMAAKSIDTPLRIAMFVAQAAHETAGFKYLEEIASGQAYENRADLGNTQPGDGVRFKGRGVFQVTGRANYARCSIAIAFANRFIDHPEDLAKPQWAAASAGWFWEWKKLNELADAGDILRVTKKINGGTNGLPDRQRLYDRAKRVLGVHA
jgi:putative chitinase